MKVTVAVLILVLLVVGCAKTPVSQKQTNNPNFQVDFLFEHEGCKVYRFWDAGHVVYFTKCENAAKSTTKWEQPEGKTTIPVSVDTN